MSGELPPVRCDDESTWRHKGEKIDLPRLLELIEENGGPEGLDLHGCDMDGVDARTETLLLHLPDYRSRHRQDVWPPWLSDERSINLRGAHLENAILSYAHLENGDLRYAHLENAILLEAHLERAHLWEAHLECAHLAEAHLEHASLYDAHLTNAYLGYAHLENVNLEGSRLHVAFWYGSYLDRTRMRRDSLGHAIGDELSAKGRGVPPSSFHHDRQLHLVLRAAPPSSFHHAREAYLSIKTNFDSIGRYEDASWAFVKERQMEKAMYFPTTPGHRWIRESMDAAVPPPWWRPHRLPRWLWWKLRSALYHTRLFLGLCPRELKQDMARRDEQGDERDEWLSPWRWARNWAFELLTGYGERPILPLLWAAVMSILAFPLLYWATGALPGHARAFTSATPSNIDWAGWGDSIIFSMTSFATLAFNRLQPDSALANILAASEAAIGVLTFALFVFTLGNRMRRS